MPTPTHIAPTPVSISPTLTQAPPVVHRVAIPPAGHIYHGVYPGSTSGEENDATPADLISYEQTVTKTAAWVYVSNNWYQSRQFPRETANWIRAAGSLPFIRLMLRSDTVLDHAEPVFGIDRILAGDFDQDLRAWFSDARRYADQLMVEFGTEVNGEWFSWNGVWNGADTTNGYGDPGQADGPERFRDAYRHIIALAREQQAHNILWVFHINAGDAPDEAWNRFENYYPGAEWIDWVAVSVYGAQTPQDTEAPSFRASMDAVYPRLVTLHKPIIVAEFGCAARSPLSEQAQWAEAALRDLTSQRWPQVIGFSWWNERWPNDDNPEHDTNMRVQDNPQLAAVFRQFVGQHPLMLGRVLLIEH